MASTPPPVKAEPLAFRLAVEGDRAFVAELSREVFDVFGDYENSLPQYLDHPAVLTVVAEVRNQPQGFIMLTLLEDPQHRGKNAHPGPARLISEVLAIAVEPPSQRKGLGRRLIKQALAILQRHPHPVDSLQLNVAHTNRQALAFFQRQGFSVLRQDDGLYPRGQRSIRMIRPLKTA